MKKLLTTVFSVFIGLFCVRNCRKGVQGGVKSTYFRMTAKDERSMKQKRGLKIAS